MRETLAKHGVFGLAVLAVRRKCSWRFWRFGLAVLAAPGLARSQKSGGVMSCSSGEVNWPCCRIRFRGDVRFLQQGFDRIVNFAQSAHPFWKGNHHDMQRDMATLLRWCPRTLPIAMPSHMLKWLIFNRLWNGFVQEPPQHNLPKTSSAMIDNPIAGCHLPSHAEAVQAPGTRSKMLGH